MSHFDRTPWRVSYALITIKWIFNFPPRCSNCCSISSWAGWRCMTYGLTVCASYLLCWVRRLSDCASWIREEGEREEEGAESGTLLNILSLGPAHFVKAETSPWPNPIKCFEGWQVQSVSGCLLLTSSVQFGRKAAGLTLPLTPRRHNVGEKLRDEEQDRTERTMFCSSAILLASFRFCRNWTASSFREDNLPVTWQVQLGSHSSERKHHHFHMNGIFWSLLWTYIMVFFLLAIQSSSYKS